MRDDGEKRFILRMPLPQNIISEEEFYKGASRMAGDREVRGIVYPTGHWKVYRCLGVKDEPVLCLPGLDGKNLWLRKSQVMEWFKAVEEG